MKKSFLIFGMFLTCVFALSACQTAQEPYSPGSGGQQQNLCTPEWVKNPKDTADAIYGMGRAKIRNKLLTKEAADGRARTQIIKTIKIKIDAYFKDFMQESGLVGNAQWLQVGETIDKHIISEIRQGCKIIKHEFCPDGEVWSLAMLTLNQVEKIKSTTKQKLNEFAMNKNPFYHLTPENELFEDFKKGLDSMNFNE